MKIKPDDDWRWFYDENHDRMMLDLADGMLFRSRFSRKMLTQDAFGAGFFCVDDAAMFSVFDEKCSDISLSCEQHAELVLNALTAIRFLKPLMPKSWYFRRMETLFVPDNGDIVMLTLCDTAEQARFLVVESSHNTALCLLAQPSLMLAGRRWQLGEAIKVMHDRLSPCVLPSALRYDRVG